MSGLAGRRALLASGLAAAVFAASGLPVSAARRGGMLRVAMAPERVAAVVARATGGALTEVAADGTLGPGLVTGWEPVRGARVWDLRLRERAEEVVAALGVLGEAALVAPLRARLALEAADPDLPLRLAALVVPGAGLYEELRRGDGRVTLRRVAAHWKDGRAGWFEEVELLARDPAGARLSALRSGLVDAASGLGDHAAGMLRAGGEHGLAERADGLEAVSLRIAAPVGMDDAGFVERWSLA
ncbi:hypothetical protein [Histidinibacterium lentulum]|uniref:Peptide ABC transporter substrate-binding protein n=1 Tax=Histidinibacterium lentulum TaxID=2480588 RepID=A0A3N2R6I0_9RHOB|nr:hypothetical protein [Histidinibacterium lentulum]ROU03080.1 hypothetical protein EAT49_07245 [Histidinibacterium lentulum]